MISKDRPIWCEDKTCQPLCTADTKGGGQCIGKLAEPSDHITTKVNFMSRCHYDRAINKVSGQFAINHADIIVETYLNGEALRAQGLGLPQDIINNLPRANT